MEKNVVGYRFHPTDEELINHYLKNKILGNSSLVDEAITEININNYDPVSFPLLSKIKSNDPVWYFFTRKVYMSGKKMNNNRYCYWKLTGKDRDVKDRRGNKIGLKKRLVYHKHGGARKNFLKNPWVMHEYHIKCWSHPHPESYVICKIKYKAENADIPYTTPPQVQQQVEESFYALSMNVLINPPNEPEDQSMWDFSDPNIFNNNNNNLNMLPQTPYLSQDDEEDNSSPWQSQDLFSDQDFIMQEDCNKYRPRKPLTGIIIDYYSDNSDAESIFATSYQGISSPEDSIGSPNTHFPSTGSCKDP